MGAIKRNIKEIVLASKEGSKNGTCIIRCNDYGSSLQHFLDLYQIALADYPELKLEEVSIVKYGGDRFKRTFGIEFSTNDTTAPTGWIEIHEVHLTL